MDRFGVSQFKHLRLQAALQKVFVSERKHVIEFELIVAQHADAAALTQNCGAFEQTTRIFFVERQQNTVHRAVSKRESEHCRQFALAHKTTRKHASTYRAALRNLATTNLARHTSNLARRPNSPHSLSSWSRRSFSNGLRGVLNVRESATNDQNVIKTI